MVCYRSANGNTNANAFFRSQNFIDEYCNTANSVDTTIQQNELDNESKKSSDDEDERYLEGNIFTSSGMEVSQ